MSYYTVNMEKILKYGKRRKKKFSTVPLENDIVDY